MNRVLAILREATERTSYEGKLYLVGGFVRDRLLGVESDEDIDIVLEGDASALAESLHKRGIAGHPPVTYPRFGTAMLSISGAQVELVGARKESYDVSSRKPSTESGTLLDDVLRRDFTINTLLENLHTGEILDLTDKGRADLASRLIRTPRDPVMTFSDDPLRLMRAARFAARLGFRIEESTWEAMSKCADRLSIVSGERIREEFVKILMHGSAVEGLELLRRTGLLAAFAPELAAMYGVTQNAYHIHDVWTHTMRTLESIPVESGITLRLAALLHDTGKVVTRTVDEDGEAHFYGHQNAGERISRSLMHRLRFSNAEIDHVAFLISMHLRVGEYQEQWTDAAVRRLIRDVGSDLDNLIQLTVADKAAANPDAPTVDIEALLARIDEVKTELAGQRIASPLDGREIMRLLVLEPGPEIGEVKHYLESEIIQGNLLPGDKGRAAELVLRKYGRPSE